MTSHRVDFDALSTQFGQEFGCKTGIELAIQTSTVVADEFDVAYFLTI